MSAFEYPARLTTGSDGRVLVEFIDFPRLATDGKNKREALEEAMDALGSDLSIRLSHHERDSRSLGPQARPSSGARAALAGAKTRAISGDAGSTDEQLRIGSPTGCP